LVTNSQQLFWQFNAAIDRQGGTAIASIRTDTPTAREIIYQFSMIEVFQIQAAIAQELDVTIDAVRRLASYRIRG